MGLMPPSCLACVLSLLPLPIYLRTCLFVCCLTLPLTETKPDMVGSLLTQPVLSRYLLGSRVTMSTLGPTQPSPVTQIILCLEQNILK